MATYGMAPSAGGVKSTTVNGRTYSSTDGAPVNGVPEFDRGALEANGWVVVKSTNSLTPVVVDATRARTFAAADAGAYIYFTNGSSVVATVPVDTAVDFPVGTVITVEQHGAGALSIAEQSGTVIHGHPGLNLAAQYSVATLRKVAADLWTVHGDLSS